MRSVSSLCLLLLAACASTPTTSIARGGPRGLRASEHLDAAKQHEEIARQARSYPDLRGGGDAERYQPAPWFISWNEASEHDRVASVHRGRAGEIQAEFDELCAGMDGVTASTSPLQRYAMGGWNTSTGVIVYLKNEAGPADKLRAEIECHRAWMMLAPSDMDDCPLDLPGISIDARGDGTGITVSIVIKDANLVGELQRRTAHELEAGMEHHGEGAR